MRELSLLHHVYRANAQLPAAVTIPPGDDMGAMRLTHPEVLVTVDQVADGVHFDLTRDPLHLIGRKAMTRNLSDVAAMAALPRGAVAAACLPRSMSQEQAEELFDTMRFYGLQFQCPLIGGDVSVWDGRLLLSVTVLAESAGVPPVLRRGAQVGDAIYVTGALGGSLASGRHLCFEPRLAPARWLATHHRPHCMIDLSDGLARDLGHLMTAADLSALVEESLLPMHRDVTWRGAVSDGEDYELCFTLDPTVQLPASVEGVALTRVGAVTARGEWRVSLRTTAGGVENLDGLGWEHAA